MSCCGASRLPSTEKGVSVVGTRSAPVGSALQQQQEFPVSEQPTAHPGISPFPFPGEASSFRPPDITTPPPVHSMAHLTGTANSLPPTSSTVHGSLPPSPSHQSTIPQMGMYGSASPVVDPNGPLSPLRRPSPTYPTSGSPNPPNLLSKHYSSADMPTMLPIDEGKMSVTIDLGERRPPEPHPTPCSKLTVMV